MITATGILRGLAERAGLGRPEPPRRAPLGSALLAAEDVVLRYGDRAVLDGVGIAVHAGEVLALVGPNGAGKSTLLSVLSGDVRPDAGGVELMDRPLPDWSEAERALRRAVLPQHSALSFPFTVGEVVGMGRAPWASLTAARRDGAVVAAAMRTTDVGQFAARGFPSLSGGEQARVMLARVLAQETQVLLLDEPTASLDLRHQELVLAVARERAADGDAVVAVLHDLGLAAAYADRVAILSDGVVAACAPPEEALDPELLSEVYACAVEVLPHPRTGVPLVLPVR